MDLSRIKDVAKNRGFLWKTVAEYVGLTPNGLTLSCEKGTLTVANLLKISEFIGMNPVEWFDDKALRPTGQKESYAVDRERGAILLELENLKSEFEKLKKEVVSLRLLVETDKSDKT